MFAGTDDFHSKVKTALQQNQHRTVKTLSLCRHYIRITLTPTESNCGEINKFEGITGSDETRITLEQVTLVRCLIGQLQWTTTPLRPDSAKRLNAC